MDVVRFRDSQGIRAETYCDTFAFLKEKYIAPGRWLSGVKSRDAYRFGELEKNENLDFRLAMKRMPPLLRTYLAMGGWISGHAMIDRDLNTVHVFTGLGIASMSPSRAGILKSI